MDAMDIIECMDTSGYINVCIIEKEEQIIGVKKLSHYYTIQKEYTIDKIDYSFKKNDDQNDDEQCEAIQEMVNKHIKGNVNWFVVGCHDDSKFSRIQIALVKPQFLERYIEWFLTTQKDWTSLQKIKESIERDLRSKYNGRCIDLTINLTVEIQIKKVLDELEKKDRVKKKTEIKKSNYPNEDTDTCYILK